MFSKGSRYRNLPETVSLNTNGERFQGKVMRRRLRALDQTPDGAPESRFLHTVLSGDRLDLLAYKYYGDTTRWWLIGDSNPEWSFPLDLLDERPIVEEGFLLSHNDFEKRYSDLLVALRNIGEVHSDTISFFSLNEPFRTDQIASPDFLEETILVVYAPAARGQVLDAITANGFHRLSSFGFPRNGLFAESFTIDDPAAKGNWRNLIDALRDAPGIVDLQTELTEASLDVVYNTTAISREGIVNLIDSQGFSFESIPYSRVGRKIRIPPNKFV
jgi:hypothetical protein